MQVVVGDDDEDEDEGEGNLHHHKYDDADDRRKPSNDCVLPPSHLYLPAIPQVSFFHFGLQVALEKFLNKLQHFRRVPRPMTPLTMTLPSYPFTSEAQPLLVTISNSSSSYLQNETRIMPQEYLKDLHFSTSEFQRSLRMTVIDFIGNVGGLFGLCLGFSLISFFELLYWFLIRTSRRSIPK